MLEEQEHRNLKENRKVEATGKKRELAAYHHQTLMTIRVMNLPEKNPRKVASEEGGRDLIHLMKMKMRRGGGKLTRPWKK